MSSNGRHPAEWGGHMKAARSRLFAVLLACTTSVVGVVIGVGAEKVATTEPGIHCDTPTGQCNVLLVETDEQAIDTMFNPNTMQLRSSYMPKLHDAITNDPGWYS